MRKIRQRKIRLSKIQANIQATPGKQPGFQAKTRKIQANIQAVPEKQPGFQAKTRKIQAKIQAAPGKQPGFITTKPAKIRHCQIDFRIYNFNVGKIQQKSGSAR